jgi:hypothetical protein
MNDDEIAKDERATVLRAAIDEGIAELDAGVGREMTVADLMAEVHRDVGLAADDVPKL